MNQALGLSSTPGPGLVKRFRIVPIMGLDRAGEGN